VTSSSVRSLTTAVCRKSCRNWPAFVYVILKSYKWHKTNLFNQIPADKASRFPQHNGFKSKELYWPELTLYLRLFWNHKFISTKYISKASNFPKGWMTWTTKYDLVDRNRTVVDSSAPPSAARRQNRDFLCSRDHYTSTNGFTTWLMTA